MESRDVLKKFAVELLSLPVRQPVFIALLKKRGLLPGNTESKLKAIHLTEQDAAQLLVNEIDRTLVISRDSFDKLISAMKEYKDSGMEQLAIKLEGAAKPNPAGTYVCTYLWHSMRKIELTCTHTHTHLPHYFFRNFNNFYMDKSTLSIYIRTYV